MDGQSDVPACLTACVCLQVLQRFGLSPRQLRAPGQYAGLKNGGATCYMNAVFQQLFMQPGIRAGILGSAEVRPCRQRNLQGFPRFGCRAAPSVAVGSYGCTGIEHVPTARKPFPCVCRHVGARCRAAETSCFFLRCTHAHGL